MSVCVAATEVDIDIAIRIGIDIDIDIDWWQLSPTRILGPLGASVVGNCVDAAATDLAFAVDITVGVGSHAHMLDVAIIPSASHLSYSQCLLSLALRFS